MWLIYVVPPYGSQPPNDTLYNEISPVSRPIILLLEPMPSTLTLSLPEGYLFIDHLYARRFSKKLLYWFKHIYSTKHLTSEQYLQSTF
jgi:hypothetical protein